MLRSRNQAVLVQEGVGDDEIGIEGGGDGRPTGFVGGAAAAMDQERVQGLFAEALDGVDVVEEGLALRAQELWS